MVQGVGLKLTCPLSGKTRTVKWFDKRHVQFYGGVSCDRKLIRSFYGDAAERMLKDAER